jgi:EAL domain-containing protein (putative c-di-GMP-specific phosphodiesterase class I)
MILPGEFILFAEEMGLLVPIGWFVMNEACRQIKAWQDAFPRNPPLTIAVNMSSLQIRQPNVVPRILEILEKTGLSASSLEIEITESALLHNDSQTIQVLNDLKKAGIILHMDDFGTGYSSLSYLNQFPIDVVKIDRSFVSSLETNGKNAELVEAILTMAEAMGIKVIAEGIESELQRKHLKDSSCLYGQGYLFSRPMNAASTEELLAKNEALDTGPLMPLAYGLGEVEQSSAASMVTS